MLLGTAFSSAQDLISIRGTITDFEAQDEPLFFANVALKDSPVKVQTNFNGNFEMANIAPGSYTLVVSYLGYENLEVPVLVEANKTSIVQEVLHAKSIDMEGLLQTDMPVATSSGNPSGSTANIQ